MDRPESFELSKLEIQELTGWPDTLVEDYRQIGDAINELFDFIRSIESERVRWLNLWIAGTYQKNDVVRDGDWTMIANKQTDDRPAPQAIGSPAFVYTGTIGSDSLSAKQIIVGTRYTFDRGGIITGYRVNVVTGNHYIVFSVNDPLGIPVANQLADFVAASTGWITLNIPTEIVLTGQQLDLIMQINEPDPAPVVVMANYNYITQNNETVPASGEIRHANKLLGELWINKTDDDSIDRSALFSALVLGDIIDGAGTRWAIQAVGVDNGTYYSFAVAPASQGAPTGVQVFGFETVSQTPITYAVDTNFNSGSTTVQGLFVSEDTYPNIIADDNQYGADIQVQAASISLFWDMWSFSG